MKIIILSALLFCLLSGNTTHACIWIYETDLHGKPILADGGIPYSQINSRTHEQWLESRARLEESLKSNQDYKVETDLAVVTIYLGEYSDAIAKLERIEKTHPGKYETAVNLGTAYELAGNNGSALQWIREGIKRNTDSHQGSEWVHVKILESKLAIEHDPLWLLSHPVLGMDFGRDKAPTMPLYLPLDNNGQTQTAKKVRVAIIYQLIERLGFVKAPDPHVADLYFELANLEALVGTLEKAVEELTKAEEFGFPSKEIIATRIHHYQSVIKQNARKVKKSRRR